MFIVADLVSLTEVRGKQELSDLDLHCLYTEASKHFSRQQKQTIFVVLAL